MGPDLKAVKSDRCTGVDIIIEDLKSHPCCPHGPTLMFSKDVGQVKKYFYSCSACRDRKLCNFFLWADEKDKVSKHKLDAWECERITFLKGINHRRQFLAFNKVSALPAPKRSFCNTCSKFIIEDECKHAEHSIISDITDNQLSHPSELLPPLVNAKKEAQYLFSKESVKFLVDTFLSLNYKYVICIGTPRIHEYIQSSVKGLSSILLDIDRRYHNFFGPLEFCWYNSFNNHFFFKEAQLGFEDFLKSSRGENTVLVTDPPFGGRTEPLAQTFSTINNKYKSLTKGNGELPMFWIFPYFMEPQIQNSLPEFQMVDYKVEYDNHPLFHNGSKGRKQGSPVRIFTNISCSQIKLPPDNYRFCHKCNKWVAKENKHCMICAICPSKNGQTYTHCKLCKRCVKPNWRHCSNCQRCAQLNHLCKEIQFNGVCLTCKKLGHKKADCPEVYTLNSSHSKRRKQFQQSKSKKRKH
ncbi:rRNA N6-adenosine-methyltransferase ZCCHC4 isoform X1 [Dendroctonus ponderosae]|uniref:CCHC-type domain-containing protein n=1 Tax=Dendroctonus ponderosae TaxID=77166 RepID=U4UM18_DENPD|nr:rRNA N6-adenosine-methyltransferase ZCCHC4 isoform X1 [Dendroctonus ponderosae]ERL95119.1 hypothetical protein D910_12389 [Dendroctonus ponderosae]